MPDGDYGVVKRTRWMIGGLVCRANEHGWSYERWKKKRTFTSWAAIFATIATGGAITTVISGNSSIAWLSVIFGAFAAGVTAYERFFDPVGTANEHALAQRRFELLVSDFRNFLEISYPRLEPEEAANRFEELARKRQEAIEASIAVEPEAQRAIAARRTRK